MHLSIEKYLDQIFQEICIQKSILCISPTGSGKSTVLPKYLLENTDEKIWLLQPRQAAAKMVARRIAEIANVTLGEEVGYHVRFARKTSSSTIQRHERFPDTGILILTVLLTTGQGSR